MVDMICRPEGCGGDPLPQQELDRMDRAVGAVLNCVKPRLAEITELLVVPPQVGQPLSQLRGQLPACRMYAPSLRQAY